MQLVRHGSAVVAIIERRWERDYLSSVRGRLEWVPLYQVGSTVPLAEIHTGSRRVRLCEGQGQPLFDQQEVELHPLEERGISG
jgi:hypothetical protein